MKPAAACVIVLLASIGYVTDDPPIVWFTIEGKVFDAVPLLEHRGDSIRVVNDTWIRLDQIVEFRDEGSNHPFRGGFLGCVIGGLAIGTLAEVTEKEERGGFLYIPPFFRGCVYGATGGMIAGCMIGLSRTHRFHEYSIEQKRAVIRSILKQIRNQGDEDAVVSSQEMRG